MFGFVDYTVCCRFRMKIKIVSVGKLKDDFNRLGVLEYAKRLSRFCEVEIKETPEENFVKTPSNSEIAKILQKESVYIEKELVGKVIVMDIGGKNYSSEEFSKLLKDSFMQSNAITFVIGGSYGLDESIKKRADLKMSFSKMTFPHGLFRVMLMEQIYRAMSINANMPYHK